MERGALRRFRPWGQALLAGTVAAGLLAAGPAAAQDIFDRGDPAYLSVGLGWFGVQDNDEAAVDLRLEYRHDAGLWILKPWAGLEGTSDGGVWGGAGLYADVYLGDRLVLTPSLGAGAYAEGDGKDLGSALEFRSQLELAYRFADRSRLGLALSHLSNAGIGDDNPGVEVVSV